MNLPDGDGDLGSLLQIWDLDSDDINFLTPPTSTWMSPVVDASCLLPEVVSTARSFQTPKSNVKLCKACQASNIYETNWCIECGVAFIGRSVTPKHGAVVKSKYTESHSYCSDVKYSYGVGFPKPSSKPHWETSKSYSWRKPSSRVFSSQCEKKQGSFFPCGLSSCPTEILLHIFSYLKHSELYICMFVCKLFHCIASDKSLWRNISLHKMKNVSSNMVHQIALMSPHHLKITDCKGTLQNDDIIEFCQSLGNQLKSLTIEMSEFGYYKCDLLLLSAADYCKNLSSVSIDWIPVSEETIAKMLQTCRRVEELSIKHPAVQYSALQSLIICHCDWIKKLHLESTLVTEIFAAIEGKQLCAIESFKASFNLIDGCIIRKLAFAFPSLGVLHVHCMSKSTILMEESLEELLNLPLRKLCLHNFGRNILSTTSCCILSQMSTLRYLGLDCLVDEGIEVLCQGDLSLETLDLSGSFVTDHCLSLIVESPIHSLLEVLKLNYCDGINDAAMKRTMKSFSRSWRGTTVAQDIGHFIHSCPSLKCIELLGIHCAHELENSFQEKFCKIIC